MIGISSIIAGIAKPFADVISKFVTRKEDLILAEAEIKKIQNDLEKKIIDNQTNLLNTQKELMLSEFNGTALQRNWRPVLMWVIVCIIGNNYLIAPIVNNAAAAFNVVLLPILELPNHLFNLMTISLGGYVVGRSAEKIIPQYVQAKSNSVITEQSKVESYQTKLDMDDRLKF
jgi:hypothetical protein